MGLGTLVGLGVFVGFGAIVGGIDCVGRGPWEVGSGSGEPVGKYAGVDVGGSGGEVGSVFHSSIGEGSCSGGTLISGSGEVIVTRLGICIDCNEANIDDPESEID